jgi:hypothetical protein
MDNLEAWLGDVHCLCPARQRRSGVEVPATVRSRKQPKRLHLSASQGIGKPRLCGAGGGTRTPTGIAALRIFLPTTAFAALASRHGTGRWVCGLDYPFTLLLAGENAPEGRCCPSSLYTFPSRRPRLGHLSGLGSGLPGRRFPRVWAVLHPGFPLEHSSCSLSPLRLPLSPRPRDPPSISFRVAPWKEVPDEQDYRLSRPRLLRRVRPRKGGAALRRGQPRLSANRRTHA